MPSPKGPTSPNSASSVSTIPDSKELAVAERAAKRAAKSAERKVVADEAKDEGNNHFRKGEYHEAIVCYITAVALGGPKAIYLCNIAAAYLKLGLYAEAAGNADKALQHDPSSLKARYRRGIARKELNLLREAVTDFETVLAHDPNNTEAQNQLAMTHRLLDSEDSDTGSSTSSDGGYPPHDGEKWDEASDSDSSDCLHVGNGISCRFYNHNGCSRGENCRFSHAPDDKSVRDKLGKNVCIYYLIGICKFGGVKCIYSHSKRHLDDGWWNHEDEVEMAKVLMTVAVSTSTGGEGEFVDKVTTLLQRGGFRKYARESRAVMGDGEEKGTKGKETSNGRGRSHRSANGKPMADRAEERRRNWGFTEDEVEELLCQGVKPWDDDAWDVMRVLNGC